MDNSDEASGVEHLDARTEADWSALAERVIRERRDPDSSVWEAVSYTHLTLPTNREV